MQADVESWTIDAHHHLWQYSAKEYGWLDESMMELRRDFLTSDLERELKAANVDGTIVVQARQTREETAWLLSLTRQSSRIRGVVGWADIASENFPNELEQLAQTARLVGLRHVVQAEPKEFLDGPAFNRGISAMRGSRLVYDVLIYERQLEEATRFVDRHPEQRFVLDHIAKPKIAMGEMEPWKQRITELARRPNVWCKVSGMVTEANPKRWTPDELRPYLDAVVEAFGARRLMAGSDWPVCLVGTSYKAWWELLRDYFAAFTKEERESVFGGCAMRVYGLGLLEMRE
ncbi:MAG TPA: amidohydrolase family protein [Acidobacteriaceae bacterium]|nr:amidohydrolase family protein [Acidobacteriaceae bacterium]